MRAQIINKEGKAWNFKSIKAAKAAVKREYWGNYVTIDGVRVYDDRKNSNLIWEDIDLPDYEIR